MVSRLYIYNVFHVVDSVEDHLSQLEQTNVGPDLVALELPESGDTSLEVQNILKKSPATGIAWWYIIRRNKKKFESQELTSGRADTEFEAGRQLAESIDVPVIHVDLKRDKLPGRYTTWWRLIRDSLVMITL